MVLQYPEECLNQTFFYRSRDTLITTTTEVPDCNPNESLKFLWTVIPTVPTLQHTQKSSLFLPANSLQAATSYQVTVVVAYADDSSKFTSSSVIVAVGVEPLSVSIGG